ncbi:alpha/beta fold hydrolase [Streptomyces sp. CNQ085]|uniref:alpha/beta fold hydrolase n=1 Tax=Streptomyces sp. CNQ085 TaxID=2886944 RepID=UPI0035B050AD
MSIAPNWPCSPTFQSNWNLYPAVHEWLRPGGVPVLAVWGRNDEIFGPAGAEAFRRDAPNAEILLLDGGHFLLESHLDEVAAAVLAFLPAVLAATVAA